MRLLLFTGKGGVGKTTIAAATAAHAARCGVKTLVLSTDAAHSLADAVGSGAGHVPREAEPGLFVQQVDPQARTERSWPAVQEYLVGLLESLDVEPLPAAELTQIPGAEEILALLEVRDQVEHGPWDLVVVDCAPTAETLRLLTLPAALARYLDGLLPMERRVIRAMSRRPRAVPLAPDHLVAAASRLTAELAGVQQALTADAASIRLVLTPESVVVAEARRTWTALAMHGYRVDGLVANRMIPAGGDEWRAAWAGSQQAVLADVRTAFDPLPVVCAAYGTAEPVGLPALAELGAELYGSPGARGLAQLLAPPSAGEVLAVERDGVGYRLAIRLPLADRDDVQLDRQGDELLLQVAGRRRALPLPSALRRCTVAGARLRDGWLRVAFRPDPALWRPL